MTAAKILAELSQQGIQVWLKDQQLQYRAPKGALTADLRSAIVEHKSQLINLLQQLEAAKSSTSGEAFPLSEMQQAYWMGHSEFFELGNISAHLYAEFEFTDLDLPRLNRACQALIKRHDMLRMVITPEGQQQILPELPDFKIEVVDLCDQSADVVALKLETTRRQMVDHGPRLDRAPLVEIVAHRINATTIRVHLSFSLLAFDGGSFKILSRELPLLYQNPAAELPSLTFSYREYIAKLNELQQTEAYRRAQVYWQERLSTLPPAPELPLAKNPAAIGASRNSDGTRCPAHFVRRLTTLEPALWLQLKDKANQIGLTPSGLLCSAYAEVIATWNKNSQFIINLLSSNRLPIHPQIGEVIGNFSSTSLLAVDRNAATTFEGRAKRIQEQLWQDFEHSQFSGVEVLRELHRIQGGSNRASAPVVFASNLDAREKSSATSSNMPAPIFSCIQTPQVWLDHSVIENEGTLLLIWDAVEELFPDHLLNDMFAAYEQLLRQLVEHPEIWQTETLSLVPASQVAQRQSVNATKSEISAELLHTLFVRQAQQRSPQTAVRSSTKNLTYAELDQAARRVGQWLRQNGARPNTLVAVVMEKGWEQVVAVLGTLYSGAAYLPINPNLPKERLWYLLEQSEAGLVLTQSKFDASLEWLPSVKRLCVDNAQVLDQMSDRSLDWVQTPTDLAYVIFTSGSTGLPKGVMIDHRGAVNTVLDVNNRFNVTEHDRVFALSSLSFDLSVYDIFGTLAAGGTIIVPDATPTPDPAHWAELLIREKVTVWNSVPALMQMLAEYAESRPEALNFALRLVMLSGDWLPLSLPDQIRSLSPSAEVISLGGATEASIWSIFYPITTVDPNWKSIPYGRPMANQTFHVLNAALEPCPIWVPGELYIGGIGLAQGYWRDTEKTEARFITHPRTGERLYRTGDLGRYLPDGNIEFLGREDFQVKVQGYRIELGEIESALEQHPAVRSVAVSAIGERHGDKRLVAYLVSNLVPDRLPIQLPCVAEYGIDNIQALVTEDLSASGACLTGVPDSWQRGQTIYLRYTLPGQAQELRLESKIAWRQWERSGVQFNPSPVQQALLNQSFQYLLETEGTLKAVQRALSGNLQAFLQQKLPEYMIPSSFVVLNKLPLTSNGKVDRKALNTLAPELPERSTTIVAPRTVVELQLAQIWTALLQVESVSVTDNFFELGGHSLLAVRLVAQIQKQLGHDLSLSTLLQNPTIEQLAQVLEERSSQKTSPLVVIQKGDPQQRPFFCVHPVGGNVLCYVELARSLGTDQPFYGLQALGTTGKMAPFTQVEAMAALYIKAIQQVQSQGPYRLGGWSMGGVIAFEMARQLQQQGQRVEQLVMIDSHVPTGNQDYDDAELLLWFVKDLGGRFGRTLAISPDELRSLTVHQQLTRILDHAKQADIVPSDVELSQFAGLFDLFKANAIALEQYRPQRYDGRVLFFQPTEDETLDSAFQPWQEFISSSFKLEQIPGNHYTMLVQPNLQLLADSFKRHFSEE